MGIGRRAAGLRVGEALLRRCSHQMQQAM